MTSADVRAGAVTGDTGHSYTEFDSLLYETNVIQPTKTKLRTTGELNRIKEQEELLDFVGLERELLKQDLGLVEEKLKKIALSKSLNSSHDILADDITLSSSLSTSNNNNYHHHHQQQKVFSSSIGVGARDHQKSFANMKQLDTLDFSKSLFSPSPSKSAVTIATLQSPGSANGAKAQPKSFGEWKVQQKRQQQDDIPIEIFVDSKTQNREVIETTLKRTDSGWDAQDQPIHQREDEQEIDEPEVAEHEERILNQDDYIENSTMIVDFDSSQLLEGVSAPAMVDSSLMMQQATISSANANDSHNQDFENFLRMTELESRRQEELRERERREVQNEEEQEFEEEEYRRSNPTSPIIPSPNNAIQNFLDSNEPSTVHTAISLNDSTFQDLPADSPLDASRSGMEDGHSKSNSLVLPNSKLLVSLFPGLQPVVGRVEEEKRKKLQKKLNNNINDEDDAEKELDVMMVLKNRIRELENECESYRQALTKSKIMEEETKRTRDAIRQEKDGFEKYKTVELTRLNQMKEEEMKKLKREKLLWERHRKASEILPTKKDRAELEALKNQISVLQDQLKQKDIRYGMEKERFKRRLDDLSRRNKELQDEVKELEQERARWLEFGTSSQNGQQDNVQPPKVVVVNASGKSSSHSKMKQVEAKPPLAPSSTTSSSGSSTKSSRQPSTSSAGSKKQQPLVQSGILETLEKELTQLEQDLQITHKHIRQTHSTSPKNGITTLERTYPDGSLLSIDSNRQTRQTQGTTTIQWFSNGNWEKTVQDVTTYFFKDTQALQHSYSDGLVVYEFLTSGQKEVHYPSGRQEITYPDGTQKTFMGGKSGKNGLLERVLFPDGTCQEVFAIPDATDPEDTKVVIEYPDGSKEVVVRGVTERFAADGSFVTILFPDGSKEVRYRNGMVKVYDASGRVVREGRNIVV